MLKVYSITNKKILYTFAKILIIKIMWENILTLLMLILLQIVLGIDNLLYISIESKHAPANKQAMVRHWGIGIAIIFRIALLFTLVEVISYFQDPFLHLDNKIISGTFNVHGLIVFFGGGFIVYTAIKEIWHMISIEEYHHINKPEKERSVNGIITMIVIMNLVFSFDSILSALALTKILWVMIVAIVISGVIMIWLSDKVSDFLQKNRVYEVLGLFILFLVGIMLLSEAGDLAHLELFGNEITAMNKTTFYFILVILILIDVVQSKYQQKLAKLKQINSNTDNKKA